VTVDLLIAHEGELAKIEETRVANLETAAGAILTVTVAVFAFAASAINASTLTDSKTAIGIVVLFMLLAAGFSVAAHGPRALKARFWTRWMQRYAQLEQQLAAAENTLKASSEDDPTVILDSWRARRAVAAYLAEKKALWVTCALMSLLVAFVCAGVSALFILT
jgi:hypothetical protein